MKLYYNIIIKTLNNLKIDYFLGADSLVGYSEGDIFKYSTSIHLYILPINIFKFIQLFFILLFNKIIIKPKQNGIKRFYKLRFKQNFFKKDSDYIRLSKLYLKDDKYLMHLGGKEILFDKNDTSIETVCIDNLKINVPTHYLKFVEKYKLDLLSTFYKQHSISFDSQSEKKAIELLYSVNKILKKSNVTYWIEGGTLLGAIRDNKLIPWDHDLDLGMKFFNQNQMIKLIKELKKEFYVSVKKFKEKKDLWILGDYRVLKIYPRKNIFFKSDLCLDLFVYYLDKLDSSDEEVYKYVVWDRNAYHKKEFFETIEQIEFYGKTIPVPSNPTKFLEVKYGINWKTPVKEWNVALDDGSIVGNNFAS
jgi:lipopolysaccharide cholinephosphotransferase